MVFVRLFDKIINMTISHGNLKRVFSAVLLAVVFVITVTSVYMFNNERLMKGGMTSEMDPLDGTTPLFNNNQEDVHLVQDLRGRLIPPSNGHYQPKTEEFDFSQRGSAARKLTNYKTYGFFVECGCGDGEYLSSTYLLERDMGWRGLLVEPDPDNVKAVLELNRRAWVAPFCMSHNRTAYETYFTKPFFPARYANIKVRCYPFYTYLLALNVTKVDFFSLDVDGDEVEVLGSVPFGKVDITVVSARFSKARGRLMGVKNLMEMSGYKAVMEMPPDYLFFVKKDNPGQQLLL